METDDNEKSTKILDKLFSIQQELKAPKNQTGRFGKHRNVESILEALKPVLKEHDCILTLDNEMVEVGGRTYVQATATLRCKGTKGLESIWVRGQAWEGDISRGLDSSQVTGAASSYARKYALGGLFAIDDTKDADSHLEPAAQAEAPKTAPKTSTYATEAQVKLLFARARDFSGLTEREALITWFKEKTGVEPNRVKKSEVDEILQLMEQERDV